MNTEDTIVGFHRFWGQSFLSYYGPKLFISSMAALMKYGYKLPVAAFTNMV